MKKLFGTDGLRGKANRYPMTADVALSLGQGIATYFSNQKGGGRIVIGKDTRRSSYMFEYALSAGISSMGSMAILTGPLPTPGTAFMTRAMRADAGIMISASHNAFDDNGIKFFDRHGYKLPDEVELQMEEFIFTSHDDNIRPTGENIGRAIRVKDAVGRYSEFLKSTFPREHTLKGLKIVIDCAHGAAYQLGPQVLYEMGAKVVTLGDSPDGTNINQNCGALFPLNVAKKVLETGADLGIALDGDADRVILCDEKGQIVDGDKILAIVALYLKQKERLKKNMVVGTIMTNMGLEVFLKENKIRLVRTQVGDRYIVKEMLNHGAILGGEPSGHIIFLEESTTGDGLLAALKVIAVMLDKNQKLSELANIMNIFPQKTENIPIKEKKELKNIKPLQTELAHVQLALHGKGRVVLRYSGTEPLLRVMVEGESDELVDRYLKSLSECIHLHL